MKKKIINGLLMAALVAGTTSSFVSCKDYSEDVKAELGKDITDLEKRMQDELADLKTEFNKEIFDLRNEIERFKCQCPSDDIAARLSNLESDVRTALANYVALQSQLGSYAKTSDLADFVTNAKLQDILKDYGKGNNGITSEELASILANYLTIDDLADYAKNEDLFDKTLLNSYLLRADLDGEFETRLAGQKAQLATLLDDVDTLKSQLSDIIGKLVTGIIIQGTYNPIFGSFSAPLDVRSTFFAAYYGKTSGTGMKFPTERTAYYVNPDEALIEADIEVMGIENALNRGSNARLFNETEGNAGTIYLTINPTTVDFDKTSGFKLVNSLGQESAFKVGELAKSNKLISLGWDVTRAGATALYEAPITLAEDEVDNVKTVIDFESLGEAVKNVYKERSKGSVIELAGKLYNEASGLALPAYGVSYSWNDELGERNVVSQYSIGATAVQPLSYSFMYGIDGYKATAPLFERVEKVFGKVFATIKELASNLDIDESGLNFAIKSPTEFLIEIDLRDNGVFPIHVDGYEEKFDIMGADGKPTTITVKIKPQDITPDNPVIKVDIADQLGTFVKDINESLNETDLSSIFEAVKNVSKIVDSVDGIQSRINSYIDRFHSLFGKLINSVNSALQPVLLYANDNDGLSRVTTGVNGTRVKGTEITLVPTSYTAELLAPAYKKVVAVTAITKNGVAADKSEVKSFNQANGLNKILTGDTKTVNISGLESGAVYEIAYTAVDYSGKVVAKKYYLNVQ